MSSTKSRHRAKATLPESLTVNDAPSDQFDPRSLLEESFVKPFCGLHSRSDASYPQELSRKSKFFSSDPMNFKEALSLLPDATATDLYSRNQFVRHDGKPDLEKIKTQSGLDLEELKALGIDVESRVSTPTGQLDDVKTHKDIVDPRRQALAALGFDVKYRWSVRTSQYTIINPSETILSGLSAFRGHEDAYGAVSIRDWGGEADIFVFFPSLSMDLENVLSDKEDVDGLMEEARESADGSSSVSSASESTENDSETVYLGLRFNYSHRGSRTFKVKGVGHIPKSNTILFLNNVNKSRRHSGNLDNDEHEQRHGREPISNWLKSAMKNLEIEQSNLARKAIRAKKTPINFTKAEYSPEEFYIHLGIRECYAESAATIAKKIAPSPNFISLWSLYIALGTVLTTEYGGSFASDDHKAFFNIAEKILEKPTQTLETVVQAVELNKADDPLSVPNSQLTFIDSVEDVIKLPEVATEADLSIDETIQITQTVTTSLSDFTSH